MKKNIFIFIVIFISSFIVGYIYSHFSDANNKIVKISALSESIDKNLIERGSDIKISKVEKDGDFYYYEVSDGKRTVEVYKINKGGNVKEGEKLEFIDTATDAAFQVLLNSYPNISLNKMGVKSKREAYIVKNLALTEIIFRTDEINSNYEVDRLVKYKRSKNYKYYVSAKRLVDYAEVFSKEAKKNDIHPVLTLNANSVKEHFSDKYFVPGPYYATFNEFAYSPKFSFDVIDNETGESIDFKLLYKDEDGVYKSRKYEDVKNGDGVYFAFVKLTPFKAQLTFKAEAKRVSGCIYKDKNNNYFLVGSYEKFTADGNVPLNYSVNLSE